MKNNRYNYNFKKYTKANIKDFLVLYDSFEEHENFSFEYNDKQQSSIMLGLLQKGFLTVNVNGKEMKFVEADVFSLSGVFELEFVDHPDDLKFFIIGFHENVINSSKMSLGLNHAIFNWEKNGISFLHIDKAQIEFGVELYNYLYNWTINNKHPYHKYIIQHLANIFIVKSIELLNSNRKTVKIDKQYVVSRQNVVFQNFVKLLEEYSDKNREVKFYASKLNVTPKYLSAVTRIYTGKSASDTIEKFVINRIKIYLLEKEFSIKEICNKMNFNSQSFFGRYFKRSTGVSPKAFVKMNS